MIETADVINKTTDTYNSFLPLPLRPLVQLSWNYWWSWSTDGPSIFRDLDPDVWEECEHNPRQLLARTAEYRLMQMATDPIYIERVRKLSDRFLQYMAKPLATETDQANGRVWSPLITGGVLVCEFGVHNSLPLYSGGLGMLAGDHLKSASDLRLPLVAVGLLYRFGYFQQRLRRDGWQEEHYGETYPEQLPIHRILGEDGTPLMIDVSMRGRAVHAQVWRADVGHVPLYHALTNITETKHRSFSDGHLYGGDVRRESCRRCLLGIGGVRLLTKTEAGAERVHLNEGHSAFLTLELARELIQSGLRFTEAAQRVRERCVFTTHTPIAAGNDEFDANLVTRAFGPTFEQDLGLTHEEFVALGRVDPKDSKEPYGLTPLAIRMCRSTNGVSRKHGEVSRALWQSFGPENS